MRVIRTATVVVASLLTVACGWRRTPVPVFSETGSTALLVGVWSGQYKSAETGRSGSISFEMASERDTAFCDVTMIPKVRPFQVSARDQVTAAGVRSESLAEPLKIRFIRLGDRRVSGTMAPYVDPDCSCTVVTTFDGTVTDSDTIAGTYTTRGDGMQRPSTGEWKVTRQKTKTGTQ